MIMLCAQGVFLKEDWEWQGLDNYEFARFGSAIATVGDLDGNRYNDVAIGAPLEEDSESGRSGSIYIYNGIPGGIMHEFTQVSLWQLLCYFEKKIYIYKKFCCETTIEIDKE